MSESCILKREANHLAMKGECLAVILDITKPKTYLYEINSVVNTPSQP